MTGLIDNFELDLNLDLNLNLDISLDFAVLNGQTDYKLTDDKNDKKIKSQSLQTKLRIETVARLKRESVSEIITKRIPKNTALHIVSNGSFDYWNLFLRLYEVHKFSNTEFYGSTWTTNKNNTNSLIELIETGKIRNCVMLTGLYLKQRQPEVYKSLEYGLKKRGHVLYSFKNHAKIILISDGKDYLVCEGSANFTANPRAEQYVISNNKQLYDFHKNWIDEMLKDVDNG